MKPEKTMKQLLKEWDTIRLMVLNDINERYHGGDLPLQCEDPTGEDDVDEYLYANDFGKTFDTKSELMEWIHENNDDFSCECPRWAIYYRNTSSSYLHKRVFFKFSHAVNAFNALGYKGVYYRSFEKRY